MSKQRLDEWVRLNESDLNYHASQWDADYSSTRAFAEFIRPLAERSAYIVDVCCGAGGSTNGLSKAFSNARFEGLDIVPELIDIGNRMAKERGNDRLSFDIADCFDLPPRSEVDGVVMLQTLAFLPDWREPLNQMMIRLKPRWIGLNSLLYAGDISCRIEVTEHARDRKTFYNVLSAPELARFAGERGWTMRFAPYEIDIDLPRPGNPDFMKTYTVRSKDPLEGAPERLQISGPLLMNWGFALLEALTSG